MVWTNSLLRCLRDASDHLNRHRGACGNASALSPTRHLNLSQKQ